MRHYLGTALLAISTLTFAAEDITVYRWVDEDNVVHFSQHQPLHDNYTEVTMAQVNQPRKSTSSETPLLAKEATVADQINEKFNTTKDSKNKCDDAKANIRTLSAFDKIQYTDNDGNVKVLNETEKTQQLEMNKKQEEVYCKVN